MAAENLHVVMLPWSAFGHLMPFFQLSIALAKAGVHVSFVSTPRNIQRLPSLHPDLHSFIDFVTIPLPPPENGFLPDGAEATVDVPFEKIPCLKSAYDNLRFAVDKFVSERTPDYLIIEGISYWATEIGRKHCVPVVFFSVFSACTDVFLGAPEHLTGVGRSRVRPSPESLMYPPEWVTFHSTVALKKHEAVRTFIALYGSDGGTEATPFSYRAAKALEECEAVVIRTCDEYEGEYLDLFRKMMGKPVIAAGLLPPETTGNSTGEIFEWLEKQKPKSVVFVGFGSECKPSKEQTYEIAHGLELSEVPFLWVLRKPEWAAEAMDDDVLPQGFREKTAGRGMVEMGWVPQVDILANPAIGGSLFHGGWGSVIEMLQFGHRLIVLPLIVDQPMNARLVVEKGLGVEVETREDGGFKREDICKALRTAMASADGEKLEANAREAALVFGDHKLHDSYIHSLVEYLKSHTFTILDKDL